VATLAVSLFRGAVPKSDAAQAQLLQWAALLHETGMSVSHIGYHKHGAYILQNADMPGFSAGEQQRLALLVFGCRGGLAKMQNVLAGEEVRAQVLSLRLAVLFHHARTTIDAPRVRLKIGRRIRFAVSTRWLAAHPLTAHLIAKERRQWKELGYAWKAIAK
jgi:exopolyphosphatase/guanosine-5'-triphosphate,3'-diphosphate pyrophosphatase